MKHRRIFWPKPTLFLRLLWSNLFPISSWSIRKAAIIFIVKYFTFFSLKGAVTDMRYFARSKFSRSLVHMKNFNLI